MPPPPPPPAPPWRPYFFMKWPGATTAPDFPARDFLDSPVDDLLDTPELLRPEVEPLLFLEAVLFPPRLLLRYRATPPPRYGFRDPPRALD